MYNKLSLIGIIITVFTILIIIITSLYNLYKAKINKKIASNLFDYYKIRLSSTSILPYFYNYLQTRKDLYKLKFLDNPQRLESYMN